MIAQDGAICRSRLLFFIIIILGKRFELQTSDLLLERGTKVGKGKDVMQGKLFHKCTHLFYCSALSLGGNVNTRRMLQPDMGSIFHIKKSMKYSGHSKLLCELSKLSNLMLLTTSDTKRTLMHLFLFINSAQRELVSICTQSMHDRS